MFVRGPLEGIKMVNTRGGLETRLGEMDLKKEGEAGRGRTGKKQKKTERKSCKKK